ncbi:hypothetical protein [Mycolicibacterium sp. GF69]|uniref:hypothetical protein n=1 Tax=Mycolicibacterium sp. GF69 TaxID=2267251 RepID=UPI0010581A2B|nr:hypothetical protein [Mycolicibacterium sp. GF69]
MSDTPSQTHFRRDAAGSRWRSQSITEQASSSQIESRHLDKALRAFFRLEGYGEWVPDEGMFAMPPGHTLRKVSDDHYIVERDGTQYPHARTS